ncbi:MAG: Oxidoreductase, short-chain dehydrogenase/reductase family [Ktedonobacterales bacterium]|jgi:3-oxoacyl-[acyl-carrier protein] reductase|nr:MAG: Oxidoreductase, short-chain dehydrogenase/reductase family [Ktedonobacterales bacterium]
MDFGLAGRVALVTAASRGLGFASAEALVGEGMSLVLCAREAQRLELAASELKKAAASGAQIETLACDVSDPNAASRLITLTRERFGRLDVLVNNAGGPPPGGFGRVGDADWDRSFQLTLMSVVRLVREALPLLRASGQGRIVSIIGTSVKQPIDDLVLSNSLRSAVVGLTKTLSREVAGAGITVNNVLPGIILTDRQRELRGADAARRGISFEQAIEEAGRGIPAGRVGTPADVGALVAFLASAGAGYITGTNIQVDGGLVLGML